jgi:kinesin family member C2/C3
MMKDDDGALSKLDLAEAISKCFKENSGCLFSSLPLSHGTNEHLDDGGLLESQQKDLEVKTAQNSMVASYFLIGSGSCKLIL